MQGRKDFQEKMFTHFQLSDRVSPDNFYRKLRETVNIEFIRKETRHYYGSEVQESIDPIVFFKLMLVGYLENLRQAYHLHGLHAPGHFIDWVPLRTFV